jgi:hypothetical protein
MEVSGGSFSVLPRFDPSSLWNNRIDMAFICVAAVVRLPACFRDFDQTPEDACGKTIR